MGIPARVRTTTRLYWLWSTPLVLATALVLWLVLDQPVALLALAWIPLALLIALRPAPVVAAQPPVAPPRHRPTTEGDERLDKAYWERRLKAARRRRTEQRMTPITLSEPQSVTADPPRVRPRPITLSPEQRRALARKLAPQVYQRARQQAPHLPADKLKKVVIREVQRLIDRKLRAANQGRIRASNTMPSPPEAPSAPVQQPPITPISLDPVREHARQREVAQILDSARRGSRRARVIRQLTPPEGGDQASFASTRPRANYRTITECLNRCNSHVERVLLEALIEEASLKPQKTALRGVISLEIQVKMFKYNVDFLVNGRLAVEVIEFSYTNDKMTQIRDRIRGNTLSQAGFLGLQLSAREILADAHAAARKIIDTARRLETPLDDKPRPRNASSGALPGRR